MDSEPLPHSNLDKLWEDIRNDPAFAHLRQKGIKLVPGIGINPHIMIVGEAPGATENNRGQPFVGKAGRVLRQLMKNAGLSVTKNCWLTNVLKYRPPGNRNPTLPEIEAARPYLRREWRYIYKPPIIVAVGAIALQALAPYQTGGIVANANGHIIRGATTIVPMIHPAFALRNKGIRPIVEKHWHDFGKWLDKEGILPP